MKTKKIAGLILASAIALGVCSCDGYFTIKPDGPREVEEEPQPKRLLKKPLKRQLKLQPKQLLRQLQNLPPEILHRQQRPNLWKRTR